MFSLLYYLHMLPCPYPFVKHYFHYFSNINYGFAGSFTLQGPGGRVSRPLPWRLLIAPIRRADHSDQSSGPNGLPVTCAAENALPAGTARKSEIYISPQLREYLIG